MERHIQVRLEYELNIRFVFKSKAVSLEYAMSDAAGTKQADYVFGRRTKKQTILAGARRIGFSAEKRDPAI